MKQGKIIELQSLRGIAAITVTLFHVTEISTFSNTQSSVLLALQKFFGLYGSLGVPIFFVLSGFIIANSVFFGKTIKVKPWDFIARRCIRIYPVYWIYLCAVIALLLVQYFVFNSGADSLNVPYIIKSFFLLPAFDANGDFFPLLIVGWSLVFEIYFYLLFFLALSLSLNYTKTLVFVAAVMVVGFVVPYYFMPEFSEISAVAYVVTNNLNFYFLAGVGIAGLYHKRVFDSVYVQRFIMLALLGWLSYMIVHCVYATTLEKNFFTPFVFSCLIVAYCTTPKKYFVTLYQKLALVGDASYTLYLSHPVFIILMTALWKRDMVLPPSGYDLISISILSLVLVIISLYLYRFIEMPLIRYLSKAYSKRQVMIHDQSKESLQLNQK